jgi:transmembrane sensor
MGDVVRFDDRRRIQEEAATWLSRVDRGLTHPERSEIDAWFRADPRHVAAFLELAKTWDKLEDLSVLSGLVELPPAKSGRFSLGMRLGATAALLGGLLFSMVLWNSDSRGDHPLEVTTYQPSSVARAGFQDPSNSSDLYATGAGEVRRITLADGTVVSMNTRSTLSVSYSDTHRSVTLQVGEATFDVAHEPERPFVVEAAGKTIGAVGTVFTVRAKSKTNVSIIVSEGRVAVSAASTLTAADLTLTPSAGRPTRLLEAGDRLQLIGREAQLERLSSSDIEDALAWQHGMIVFQGDALVDALGEVSRYSDARFELADESIGTMKVAGVFQTRDLNGFIDSLRANLGVGATALPDGTLSLYRLDPPDGEVPQR